jgi:hypothetical protein
VRGLSNLSKIFVGIADGNGKSHSKDCSVQDSVNDDSTISIEESSVSNSESNNKDGTSLKQNNVASPLALKRRQKLHWGYDTPLDTLRVCGCSYFYNHWIVTAL